MKQTVTTSLEEIKTDTHDKLEATLTFSIEGRRNVPNLETCGRAADAATWLYRQMIENAAITDQAAKAADLAAIREKARVALGRTPAPATASAPTTATA